MKNTVNFLLSAVLLFIATNTFAALNLNRTISDGMVLQQKSEARIWGKADAGKSVKVTTSWNAKEYIVRADRDGKWEARVSTPEASYTNYSITVASGKETKVISDVLVGEVWLASGQSNMEMPIRGFFNCPVEGSSEVIAAPATPDRIRMITVDVHPSEEPLDDIYKTRGWEKAGPETVSEMSAAAYFFALRLNRSLDVPVGIVSFARGGARVEGWLPKETLERWGDDLSVERMKKWVDYHRPYLFYNGMEQPVKGYTAKGFIWYQGCSNVGSDKQFVERMTELVRQWREDWGDIDNEMPFYMVEIAPFRYSHSGDGVAAALRQAQHEAARAIPNSGIVVTNDLVYSYEIDNIHPCRKQPVGNRLAYMALHRNYGFSKLPCDSPEVERVYLPEGKTGEIRVKLSNCPNGLNRLKEITGLEVRGQEGEWKAVSSADFIWGENALSIRCAEVPEPVGVRYGWGDFKPGNLTNAEGLGVVPFNCSIL